jgi:lipoate synthase
MVKNIKNHAETKSGFQNMLKNKDIQHVCHPAAAPERNRCRPLDEAL